MSKYTTEVRFICETYAGYDTSKDYKSVNDIIENSWRKIFDFDFPIFDPEYRSVLCKKILKHYYTREIGLETVGLWKLKLETKMNEIMPYYNKLYATESLNFNPLYDVDYTKEHSGTNEGNEDTSDAHTGTIGDAGTHTGTVGDSGSHTGTIGDSATHTGTIGDVGTHTGTIGDSYSKEGNVDDTSHDEGSKSKWDVYSDTPQGALTNVANETYLTDARKITESNEDDGTNERDYDESGSNTRTFNEGTGNTRTFNESNANTKTFNEGTTNTKTYNENMGNTRTFNESNDGSKEYSTTTEYTEHIMGKVGSGTYAKMIMEYRESLLNIDVMIIDELKSLFMLVW